MTTTEPCKKCNETFPASSAVCPFCNHRREWAPPPGQEPSVSIKDAQSDFLKSPNLAKVALNLACPKCGQGVGRQPILVETWEDQGFTFTGKQKYMVRTKEVPGYCSQCSKNLFKMRILATIAMGFPFWLFCFAIRISPNRTGFAPIAAIFYGLYLLKKCDYGWADYLLYGLDLQTNLAGQIDPMAVNDASVKFPTGCLYSILRCAIWIMVAFLALVVGDVLRFAPSSFPAKRNATQTVKVSAHNGAEQSEPDVEAAFSLAFEKKNLPLFRKLLADYPDKLQFRTKIGATILHFATRFDDPAMIKEILATGFKIETRDGNNGFTALHWSAREGLTRSIQTLLEAGAEIDSIGKNGHTPLHVAILTNRIKAIELLLQKGADPYIRIPNGMDCFALTKRNRKILAILEKFRR